MRKSRAPEPPRWETLASGEILDRGVFGIQEIVRRSPRTGHAGTYQVLRIPNWANVVALTPEDEVVLVAQYRHGLDRVTLEIPGGVLDPGEDLAAGVARELEEETGHTGDPPVLLGTVHPNPAIQDNACTTWLITGARASGPHHPVAGGRRPPLAGRLRASGRPDRSTSLTAPTAPTLNIAATCR